MLILKSLDASINIDIELENNYKLILENQKTRNLLALKLGLTYHSIESQEELRDEIDDLIELVEVELKRESNNERLIA